MTDPSQRPPEAEGADAHTTPADQTNPPGDESSVPYATGADSDPRFAAPAYAGEVGTFGRYRVLQKIGQGGMGAVFLGYDPKLERKVALKVVLPQYAASADARERFIREARAAARVRSDHVVTIYDVGEEGEIPFIAMEYLLGLPLDKFLKTKGELPLTQALRVCRETAVGLAAAHALGLTHRDIKPGNIWLESPGGRVKLLDFGLARLTTDDVHLTGTGAVMGTPAYMSPEQGRGRKVDHRSDLFSLGVVLYRLATGKMPFTGRDTMSLLTSLAVDTPAPVRQLNPQLPEALEAVVARLLAKEPAQRYQTAREVVEAIRDIEHPKAPPQSGPLPSVVPIPVQPIVVGAQTQNVWEDIVDSGSVPVPLATPADTEAGSEPPAAKPVAKSPRRRPERKVPKWPLFAAAAVLLVAAAGLAYALLGKAHGTLVVMNADPDVEIVIKKNGEVVHDRTREREFRLRTGTYTVELADPRPGARFDPDTVEVTRDGTPRVTYRPGISPAQGKLIVSSTDPDAEIVIKRDGQVVQDRTKGRDFTLEPGTYTVEVASPKPGTKITPEKVEVVKGRASRVQIDVASGPSGTPKDEVIHDLPKKLIDGMTPQKPANVESLDHLDPAKIPAEERFDWQPRELVAVLGSHRQRFPGSVRSLVVSPDGTNLLAGAYAMEIASRKQLEWPPLAAFSPDGRRGAAANKVWNLAKPKEPPVEYRIQGDIIAFLTEDVVLAQTGDSLVAWKLDPREPKPVGERIKLSPLPLAISPNRKLLAAVFPDATCHVFDLGAEGPKKKFALPEKDGKVWLNGSYPYCLSISDTGVLVTLDASSQAARVWDVSGKEPELRHTITEGPFEILCAFPKGDMFVRGGVKGFQLWAVAGGKPQKVAAAPPFGPEFSSCHSIAVTQDGATIITGHNNGAVRFWGHGNGLVIERTPLAAQPLVNPDQDFSPTGQFAILHHEDGRNRLWKLTDLSSHLLTEMPQSVVRFRPDGRAVAANVGGSLRTYPADGLGGMWTQEFAIGAGQLPIAYSPDGKWLAAYAGGEFVIWDVSEPTPREVGRAPGLHTRRCHFTPDGRFLIAAAGPVVKVWAMTPNGPAIRYERKWPGGINDYAVSPDGKAAAFVSGGAATIVCDIKEGVLERRKPEYPGAAGWVDFSPDGRALLLGGGSVGLKLADAATGKVLHEWPTPRGVPTAGRFHPDGRHLFVTNADGTTHILRLPSNADRRAAEYALRIGGTAWLDDAPGGIKKVEELPTTRWLALTAADLTGCKGLDDAGLEKFLGCMNLKRLTMRDTKVSDEAVTALAAKIPQCRIEWNGGLIEPKK